jgi:hypothetical protein
MLDSDFNIVGGYFILKDYAKNSIFLQIENIKACLAGYQ